MVKRAILAAGVLCLVAVAAAAGEEPPAPQLKPGVPVKLAEDKPEGSISGWVLMNRGGQLEIAIEKISGEERRPGELFVVGARTRSIDGKERALESDVAVLRQFGVGDKVDIAWFRVDKRPRVATATLLKSCPRSGTLAGQIIKRESDQFQLKVDKAGPGAEGLVGQKVGFFAVYVPNPNKNAKRRYIPDPEQVKLFDSLSAGDLVEVTYKADGRLRVESLKKTGRMPDAAPKDPKDPKEPKEPKKSPPSSEKKPAINPDDDF
jgi:hypothetical protein